MVLVYMLTFTATSAFHYSICLGFGFILSWVVAG